MAQIFRGGGVGLSIARINSKREEKIIGTNLIQINALPSINLLTLLPYYLMSEYFSHNLPPPAPKASIKIIQSMFL